MTKEAESIMTLKERLEQGQYTVDAKKVADAMLRSPLSILLFASGGGRRHKLSEAVLVPGEADARA